MKAYIPLIILTLLIISCGSPKTGSDYEWGKSRFVAVEQGAAPSISPYPSINGGSFSGQTVPDSPDPLVGYVWQGINESDGLQVYYLKPVRVTANTPESFENLESLTGDHPALAVHGTGTIMLDFGVESAAWLEFESPDLSGSVEMSISEYNEPAILNEGAQNPVKTKAPVKHGTIYRLELNDELYEGVRFGWIHVNEFDKPWHITNVRLVCQTKPANYTGSFACSNPMLTKIWYTGAYTVKLNFLKDYISPILMERSDRFAWSGDLHTIQAASMVAFSNLGFVRRSLMQTADVKHSYGIETYPLLWVLSLFDYYMYSGDRETLNASIPGVIAKLEHGNAIYGTNPPLRFYGWDERLGAGFEDPDCPENQRAYKMLFIRACSEFAQVMTLCGQDELSKKYSAVAQEKITGLRTDAEWYKTFGLHAGADAVNAGFTDEQEKTMIFKREFANPLYRVSYSPFNQFFILRALSKMGKYDEAIESIVRLWGGQINLGATSFWEVYRPEWNTILSKNDAPVNCQCGYTSLCHPWGAGVTKWLSEEVLGLKPTEPGFKTWGIIPHMGSTLTRVSGKILTPHGELAAELDVDSGNFRIRAPEGTNGAIGIPKVGRRIEKISIDGKTAWNGNYQPVMGIGEAAEDGEYVYFRGVPSGSYSFDIKYAGAAPVFSEASYSYPAKFLSEDSSTSGNWAGVYGRDGYFLCNYDGAGKHVQKLPAYVESVNPGEKKWLSGTVDTGGAKVSGSVATAVIGDKRIGKAKNVHWVSGTEDTRALPRDDENGGLRNIGAITTQNPRAPFQTFSIDIGLSEEREYQVALYFVDWEGNGRRQAVEMFDYASKNLISPVRMVKDFKKGRYLVYSYNKSVRFRIYHIRGDDAVLSGVFFDSK